MISRADTKKYRAQLLAMRNEIDQDRTQLRMESLEPGGGAAGTSLFDALQYKSELGEAEAQEEVSILLVENEELLLKEIHDALDRLDQETFGHCESCGQKIARQRLEVLPHTRYCIRCARIMERIEMY
jgi:RNA polymerase-binding transcription factor DksA